MEILKLNPAIHTNVVKLSYITDMIKTEALDELKISCHLGYQHIYMQPFSKMKVDLATQLLSRNTAQALRSMTQHFPNKFPKNNVETTAAFLEMFGNWHLTCRNNYRGPYRYTRNNSARNKTLTTYVNDCVNVIKGMTVGVKKKKLPCQLHLMVASSTTISIAKEMTENHGYKSFYTARLCSDAIESYHACVRNYNRSPTPLIFQRMLKLISIGRMFSYTCSKSNVDKDSYKEFSLEVMSKTLAKLEEEYKKKTEKNKDDLQSSKQFLKAVRDLDFLLATPEELNEDREEERINQNLSLAPSDGSIYEHLTEDISYDSNGESASDDDEDFNGKYQQIY